MEEIESVPEFGREHVRNMEKAIACYSEGSQDQLEIRECSVGRVEVRDSCDYADMDNSHGVPQTGFTSCSVAISAQTDVCLNRRCLDVKFCLVAAMVRFYRTDSRDVNQL